MGWLKSIAACTCVVLTVAAVGLAGSVLDGSTGAAGDSRPAAVRAAPVVKDRTVAPRRHGRGSTRGVDSFAAIAANPSNGSFGFGFGFGTRAQAVSRARSECENFSPTAPEDCRVIVSVRNGCAAVARARRADGSLSQITFGTRRLCNQAQIAALSESTRPSRILAVVHSDDGAVR